MLAAFYRSGGLTVKAANALVLALTACPAGNTFANMVQGTCVVPCITETMASALLDNTDTSGDDLIHGTRFAVGIDVAPEAKAALDVDSGAAFKGVKVGHRVALPGNHVEPGSLDDGASVCVAEAFFGYHREVSDLAVGYGLRVDSSNYAGDFN